MDIFSSNFSSQFLIAAAIFTLLSVLLSFRFFRPSPPPATAADSDSSKRMCSCSCNCNGGSAGGNHEGTPPPPSMEYVNGGCSETVVTGEPAAKISDDKGASMMEQLVPEITTHTLSYLDYPSLCRLSMTNSLMRRAANDDNAWKALYQKDFTMEQHSVTPANGWKAYYASTRAVVNVNAEFFNIINDRSIQEMGQFWLNADYVKCIHASGELFSGYNAVMQSWQLAFNWAELNLQVRDARVRVLPDMAWITMKTFININARPLNMTNVYEYHNGRWCMVLHHSSLSLMIIDGQGEQQHG